MTIYRDLESIDSDIQQPMSRVLRNWYTSEAFRYENDFFDWDSDETGWTVTVIDTDVDGADSRAIEDAAGGILAVTNNDNALDDTNLQKVGEAFKLVSDKPLYYECRFAVNCTDIVNPTVTVGLCITDTTLSGGMSDGVFFIKD
ncbi:MAG: hypothetical protein JRI67_11575, partial [Deltaproteobacteria bacterium]|nr:hypothetical protein [Deltaproteobacteria bacterium]